MKELTLKQIKDCLDNLDKASIKSSATVERR